MQDSNYLKKTSFIVGTSVFIFAGLLHLNTDIESWPTDVDIIGGIWGISIGTFAVAMLGVITVRSFMKVLDDGKIQVLNLVASFLAVVAVALQLFLYNLAGFS